MADARFRSFDASGYTAPETARSAPRLDRRETAGEASTSFSDEAFTRRLRLDVEITSAVRAFTRRLSASGTLFDAILFGSRARVDHGPDRDADVAVVLADETDEPLAMEDAADALARAEAFVEAVASLRL